MHCSSSVNMPDLKNLKVGQRHTSSCKPACRGLIATKTCRDAGTQSKKQLPFARSVPRGGTGAASAHRLTPPARLTFPGLTHDQRMLIHTSSTLSQITRGSCLEIQPENKKKNICPEVLGQDDRVRSLPAPLLRCEGCSVPQHHRGMSPGELCWRCWAGDSLHCLTTGSRWGVSRPPLACK